MEGACLPRGRVIQRIDIRVLVLWPARPTERHQSSGRGNSPGASRVWRTFCRHSVMLIENWRNRAEGPDMRSIVRGTRFLSDRELVPGDDVHKWALAQFRSIM